MLQLFRNMFKSKVGVGVTLIFLVVIAIAFASSDVANTGMFGGVSGGDRVAVVGDERVDASELTSAAGNALDQMRQQNPTLTMQVFVAQGGLTKVLDQMLQRTAIAEFARSSGMRAGKRLVDSELRNMPAFRGPDGSFNTEAFRAALQQRGLSEALVRDDLESGLLARQLITPVAFSPVMPASFGQHYASLLRERRQGAVALLPSTTFAPTGAPTDAQLQAFYRANTSRFVRPERRVIRYVSFGDEALGHAAGAERRPDPGALPARPRRVCGRRAPQVHAAGRADAGGRPGDRQRSPRRQVSRRRGPRERPRHVRARPDDPGRADHERLGGGRAGGLHRGIGRAGRARARRARLVRAARRRDRQAPRSHDRPGSR
jgi:hypothetical protein